MSHTHHTSNIRFMRSLRVLPGYAQRTIGPVVSVITVLSTICLLQFSDRPDAFRIGVWAWVAWPVLISAIVFLGTFLYVNRDNLD